MAEYMKKSMAELKALCKERNLKGLTGKSKAELVALLGPARTALSLFSGAGGDTCGLERAGWTVSHFSELNDPAIKTHMAAFPASTLLVGPNNSRDTKTITDTTFEQLKGTIDLIFAGFPCQGFSHAGKKKADDPRNELVHEFVRATRLIQPTWIVGENVKGLLSRKGVYPAKTDPRPVIDIIREMFSEIGYTITYRIIDTTEVGVPQLRKRLIIVGHKGTQHPHVPWNRLPRPATTPTIRSILSPTLEGAMRLPELYKPTEQPARFWITTTETAPTGAPHSNLVRLVEGIRNLSSKEKRDLKRDEKEKIPFTEPAGLISFGVRKGGYHGQVLDPDGPSKTIICAYTQCPRLFVGLHNPTTATYWVRCLTPVECGQIQGFAADYPWQGSVKEKLTQIGNAVPPPLATAVAGLLERTIFMDTAQEVGVCEDTSDEE